MARNTTTKTAPTPAPAFDWRSAITVAPTPTPTTPTHKGKVKRRITAPAWGDDFTTCATQLLEAATAYGHTTLYRLVYLYVALKTADYAAAKAAYEAFDPFEAVFGGIEKKGGNVKKAVEMYNSGTLLAEIAQQFSIDFEPPQNPGTEENFTREIFFESATIKLSIGRESRDDATKRRNFQRVFNEFAAGPGRDYGALSSSSACKSMSVLLSQTIILLTVQYRDELLDLHLPTYLADLIPSTHTPTPTPVKAVLPPGLTKK